MFLAPPRCVHRDRRPDLNSKWRPFTSFCFSSLKVFCFVPACLFCPSRHGSRHSFSRSSPRMMRGRSAGSSRVPQVRWPQAPKPAVRGSSRCRPRLTQPAVNGRYPPPPAAIPCQPLTQARHSWEIDATVRGSPRPAIRGRSRRRPWLTQTRRSQEITPPFAGDHAAVRGSPRPAVHGRLRRRPRLTQTHRSREITPPSAAHPGPPFAGNHAAVRGPP